jgi:putative copper resistance protein D
LIVLVVTITLAFYTAGLWRMRRRGLSLSAFAVASFACAMLASAAVLVGPFDDLADASLAWHMAQHLVLSFVVAPLLLLGAPLRVLLAALPQRSSKFVARALHSGVLRVVTHPAFAWAQFAAVLYVVHFSPLYEAALENETIHFFEHVLFVVSALIFWTPVLAVAPMPSAPSHPVRLLMLFLALPMSAFLGFIFYAQRVPLYAHYAAHPGALADQQNAGALMWIAGSGPVLVALLWCVVDWGTHERRLGALADAQGAR